MKMFLRPSHFDDPLGCSIDCGRMKWYLHHVIIIDGTGIILTPMHGTSFSRSPSIYATYHIPKRTRPHYRRDISPRKRESQLGIIPHMFPRRRVQTRPDIPRSRIAPLLTPSRGQMASSQTRVRSSGGKCMSGDLSFGLIES